jgi:hypothetical protein
MMVCLDRSRQYNELQQKGTPFKVIPVGVSEILNHYLSTETETVMPLWGAPKKLISAFVRLNECANTGISVHMIATMPNKSFLSAIDITMIKASTMLMDPNSCSETQAILDDSDIMDVLARADCQYKEGKAKSLRNLIADLGFEADALLD